MVDKQFLPIVLVFLVLIGLLSIIVVFNENLTSVNESPIGGQRDDYGCLGPAGYSWDSEIDACIRTWEISELGTQRAAKLAAAEFEDSYGLTITQIDEGNCEGCYSVKITDFSGNVFIVTVSEWNVTEIKELIYYCTVEDKVAEVCIQVYQPVCGDDGNNYPNKCFACIESSVTYIVSGECE